MAGDPAVVAVVLAGGTGSRLYPASRADRPKQFLSLFGGSSMLERTVKRARTVADRVVIVTRAAYESGVRELVPAAEVLVEPAGRDTGPALLYATHRIGREYDDVVVVVLPSDHLVGEGFAPAIRRGITVAAATDRLVTFGIEPTRPETGYGYIEPAEPTEAGGETVTADAGTPDSEWDQVASFHEKPDAGTAESYVEAGHYWNAGLFAWRPDAFLSAADAPPLAPLLDALRASDGSGTGRPGDESAVREAFAAVDPVSVDYAVLESASDVAVVPASFRWDDVGAWDALDRVLDADGDGNVSTDGVALRTLDAADNVVAADDAHVSLVGVSDLAVVTWDDRVLVVPKDRAQDVKRLIGTLEDYREF